MASLDAKKCKEQVNDKEWENTENTESVVPRAKKVRRKILCYVVIKLPVKAGPVVQWNFFAHKGQRPYR